MELLILLGFLLGWATCWVQQSRYLNRVQETATETAKGLTKQLHSRLETVVAQEMEILKVSEKVMALERELDLLRYRT
jgi:uncharacterized protein Yka (UPF0111/DUF47 family)